MFARTVSKALMASAAAGMLTFALSPAHAQADTAPRSVLVRYGDLNLQSADGQAALSRRISNAAKQVCGYADLRDFRAMSSVDACRTDAIASAKSGMVTVFADAGASVRVAAR